MNADELEYLLELKETEPPKFSSVRNHFQEACCSAAVVDLIKKMHLEYYLYGGRMDLSVIYSGLKWMQMSKEIKTYKISELHCVVDVVNLSGSRTRFWYHPSMADSIVGVKNHEEGY